MTKDEKLEKINKLMKLVTESINKDDFLKSFQSVIDYVKKIEKKNNDLIASLENLYKETVQKIDSNALSGLDTVRENLLKDEEKLFKELNGLIDIHRSKIKEIDKRIKSVKDGKNGVDGKDGKDADEEIIAEIVKKQALLEVLPLIPKIDDLLNELPKKGEVFRDSLELITEEEDKLKITAIGYLEERLRKLEERPLGKGGGGTSDAGVAMSLSRIVSTETPVGLINGINKVYTISRSVNAVLLFSINGMVVHNSEYSISGNTITFTTALPADLATTSFTITFV
jgi:Asp-tRNA(Asn)/Glu-tRNA(Gln) amidotransferase C subunit